MYVYKQIVKNDIEYLQNDRVSEISHDWLNFGYELFLVNQQILHIRKHINLSKTIEIKPGSRIKVSRLNEVIRDEIKVSSQVINDLVQANFNVQSRLNNGYKYWVNLGWKETDKKDDMISFDKIEI